MSALDAARDHYLQRFQAFGGGEGDPAWLAALRKEAIERFAERGLPTTRDEAWRYTSVASLAKQRFELPESGGAGVSRADVEALSIPVYACSLFVFVDGRFSPELSTPRTIAGDVVIESLADLRASDPGRLEPLLGRQLDLAEHPFAALNTAFLEDGAVLSVPAGAVLERPIHVVFVTTAASQPSVQHPRVLVSAGAGSRAVVIQDHVSLADAPGFTNAAIELQVGANAQLDYALLQRESAERLHVSNLQARLERDARLTSHTLSLGGRLLRNDLRAVLAGPGADCELNGVFVGDGEQLVDNHTLVDHATPHCTSRQLYKGVLADRARGVFRGRVVVRPDAQKTSAEQSNPNLLLSDGAEIDTRPQLEIYADDVKCSHGSSVGQVDPDALFYLRSRALGEREARDLLARGFAGEVTSRLPLAPLREEVDQLVFARLAREAPAEETS